MNQRLSRPTLTSAGLERLVFLPLESDPSSIQPARLTARGFNEFINESVFLKAIDGHQVLNRHLSTLSHHSVDDMPLPQFTVCT